MNLWFCLSLRRYRAEEAEARAARITDFLNRVRLNISKGRRAARSGGGGGGKRRAVIHTSDVVKVGGGASLTLD